MKDEAYGIRSMLLCKTGKFSVISKEPIYRQHSQMYFENLRKSWEWIKKTESMAIFWM